MATLMETVTMMTIHNGLDEIWNRLRYGGKSSRDFDRFKIGVICYTITHANLILT